MFIADIDTWEIIYVSTIRFNLFDLSNSLTFTMWLLRLGFQSSLQFLVQFSLLKSARRVVSRAHGGSHLIISRFVIWTVHWCDCEVVSVN